MTRAEFATALRLATAHIRQRPGRLFLTSLSTVAAACVVVWVVSGYDSLVGAFGSMGDEYVGRYAVLLVPGRGDPGDGEPTGFGRAAATLPRALLSDLRADAAVDRVDPVFETMMRVPKPGDTAAASPPQARRRVIGPDGKERQPTAADGILEMGGVADQRRQQKVPVVVGIDAPEPPHTLLRGAWYDPKNADATAGAMTREAAEYLGVEVGDTVTVAGFGGRSGGTVTVTAVVEQPKRLPGPKFMVGLPPTRAGALPGGPTQHALYVPTALAEKLSGAPARTTHAGVVLKPDAKANDFVTRWADRLAKSTPPVEARTPERVDSEVANSTTFDTVRAQAYSATGISLLAALFIILTTLSMGVDERTRQFAVMRAVAFTRGQVAIMVAAEAVLLGLIGWAGGVLAGWGLLTIMARVRPGSLAEGAELGPWCVGLAGACALGGAVMASILPAWRATRVRPLEAMAPRRTTGGGRWPLALTALGLALIAVNPIVVFIAPMPDAARYGASAVACVAMVIGFVLLAPLAVALTERALGPLLARLLGLNTRLLATQLSSNLWRTVGTTVALTIGLGLFVATQIWGYSMLGPFTPGNWSPDVVVLVPGGVPDAALDAVRHVPGVVPEKFLPLAVNQVKFADDPTGAKARPSATRQDNCVMIGFDPDAALGGDAPPFKFTFVEGARAAAIAKLKAGRFCLVPDHFTRESGLGLGQKFRLLPPDPEADAVEYEIAGVVAMPGWHWMTKGFRRGRAAGLMFAATGTVRDDFATGRTTTFWGNMAPAATADEAATATTADEIKAAVTAITERTPKAQAEPAAPARPSRRNPTAVAGGFPGFTRPAVSVLTVAAARADVRARADHIIWALSELPLITLLVTSLGVMNTVRASVRARRWDFGVLRSLGVTRFGLFRLIVAEALLIGVVSCVLSFGFGTLAGYCGTGVTRYVNIRGGMVTPLVVPWAKLAVGFGIAVGLCLIAAVWPALRTGRVEPLKLLQAGRGAL